MSTILIINGPNLNMLGIREPEIYGSETLDDIKVRCLEAAGKHSFGVDFKQSNHEGDIVTWIQEAYKKVSAIIINPAAYTHTSVAIHDALKVHDVPIIEVHLSDPKTREDFRHFSYIASVAAKTIAGHGSQGYLDAIEYVAKIVHSTKT